MIGHALLARFDGSNGNFMPFARGEALIKVDARFKQRVQR